jgi:hypothetical protein
MVSDSNGCIDSASVNVTEPDSIVVTSAAQNVSCNGFSDGSGSVTVNGGVSPYTYLWSTNDSTSAISGISSGSYFVTISDTNGCVDSSSIVITEPNQLTISSVVTDETIGNADGSIDVTVIGGILPYTYSWDNGEVTEDINSLSAGSYVLTVIDSNGCIIVDTIMVNAVVGLTTLDDDKTFVIFPNPTNEYISVKFTNVDGIEKVGLFSIEGKILDSKIVDAKVTTISFDMKEYKNGTYFIQLIGKQVYNKKIVVVH